MPTPIFQGSGQVFGFVPIGALGDAKSRMTDQLDAHSRRRLVLAMLSDVIRAMHESQAFDSLGVVTPDADAANWARQNGLVVLQDRCQPSTLSAAVDDAMAWASRHFATAVAILGDLPLADPVEIRELVSRARAMPVVIVPDHIGSGTAALGLTPPGRISAHFGPDSRRSHWEAARRAGCDILELRLPTLAMDMDLPSDLAKIDKRAVATFETVRDISGKQTNYQAPLQWESAAGRKNTG